MSKVTAAMLGFWEDSKILARANPKKAALLMTVAAVVGFILGMLAV